MEVFENFSLLKNKTLTILNEIITISKFNPIISVLSNSANNTISNIENDKFLVAVVGIIKRGKSTLLNALLEAKSDILSTHVTPETARLSYLSYADEPFAIIHTNDDKQIKIPIDELAAYTSSFDTVSPKGVKEKVEKTLYAEIFFPNEILNKGFCIIDTPGVEDPDEKRSMVTLNFIDRADAVIFLISANEGGLKNSELKFLQSKILNNFGNSRGIVFVCNKISLLRPRQLQNELPKLIENNEKLINQTFGTRFKIFPIDALDAINGIRENNPDLYNRSRFNEFKEHLVRYLVEEKGKIFLRIRINNFIHNELNPLIDHLINLIKEKPKTIFELENNLKNSENQLNSLEIKTNQIFNRYLEDKKILETWIKKEVTSEFNSSITLNAQKIEELPKDIIKTTELLSQKISSKTKRFIDDLINEFDLEDVKIPRPSFEVNPKQIETSKYFSKEKIQSYTRTENGRGIGKFVGGALGFLFAGFSPPAIFIGVKIGEAIGSMFGQDNYSTKERIYFDELGLKKEIEKVKDMLIESFIKYLDFYYNEISNNVKENLERKRKNMISQYNSQKKFLNKEQIVFEEFVNDTNTLINSLTKKRDELIEILNEVNKI